MTWDVPTEFDCPSCGQTMFKKSGRGQMKPFCINENCPNFLPEDQRGYRRKPAEAAKSEGEPAAESGTAASTKGAVKAPAKKKSASSTGSSSKAETKKPAAKAGKAAGARKGTVS